VGLEGNKFSLHGEFSNRRNWALGVTAKQLLNGALGVGVKYTRQNGKHDAFVGITIDPTKFIRGLLASKPVTTAPKEQPELPLAKPSVTRVPIKARPFELSPIRILRGGLDLADPPDDTKREDTGKKIFKPDVDIWSKLWAGLDSFCCTIELSGSVPLVPDSPIRYQLVFDRNNNSSDNWPAPGVFNGDLIFVVEFHPEFGYWQLERYRYNAGTGAWMQMATAGTFFIEENVVAVFIPTSEIDMTPDQGVLPFRVVTEAEVPETLIWDAAPDEGWAELPLRHSE
jgi:hypothetical protein